MLSFVLRCLVELLTRIELVTSSLPRKCSTTELQQHDTIRELIESGRRGSNPRPPAWKASALSTELLPQVRMRSVSLGLQLVALAFVRPLQPPQRQQTISKRRQRYTLFSNRKNFLRFFYRFRLFSLFFCNCRSNASTQLSIASSKVSQTFSA